ncbi:hypothetical protein MAR_024401 [Mya arenaria]|uniref:Uncharacterized protein n=1 Tax=Mya arenaria TaxID=6604 RepID=A0ABY7DT12_MYAAR|nr:hypothetical protein MAR_024401 [Mya arenaria]
MATRQGTQGAQGSQQQPATPLSQPFIMGTPINQMNSQFYNQQTPYYMASGGNSPVLSQNMSQNITPDYVHTLFQRLDSMDNKLNQLDQIKSSVQTITDRLSCMESKIEDIETSHSFISDQYDGLLATSVHNTSDIGLLKNELKNVKCENNQLKGLAENANESVIDLKLRSMRDNYLFWGIPEGPGDMAFGGSTPSVHSGGPTYASSCGPPSTTSGGPPPAPYGANGPPLSFSAVTQPGHQDRNDPFNQYPPEVNERRRHLVPIMKQARREGNRANLVRDKLYINNRLYKAHFPSQQFELKATGLPASFGRPTLAPPSTVTPAYTRDSESTRASVPSSAAVTQSPMPSLSM